MAKGIELFLCNKLQELHTKLDVIPLIRDADLPGIGGTGFRNFSVLAGQFWRGLVSNSDRFI